MSVVLAPGRPYSNISQTTWMDIESNIDESILSSKIKKTENLKNKKRRWSWTKKNSGISDLY